MGNTSINFSFLGVHDPLLVKLGEQAEQYFFADPDVCLIKLRQFGEVLAQRVAAQIGVYTSAQDDQQDPADEPASVLLERIRAQKAGAGKAARKTKQAQPKGKRRAASTLPFG